MPHKHNADRRHHIPKMSFKVQNWPAYEAGLRRRGSLTFWIEDAALECWQTSGPSGQARFKCLSGIKRLSLRETLFISASPDRVWSLDTRCIPVLRPMQARIS